MAAVGKCRPSVSLRGSVFWLELLLRWGSGAEVCRPGVGAVGSDLGKGALFRRSRGLLCLIVTTRTRLTHGGRDSLGAMLIRIRASGRPTPAGDLRALPPWRRRGQLSDPFPVDALQKTHRSPIALAQIQAWGFQQAIGSGVWAYVTSPFFMSLLASTAWMSWGRIFVASLVVGSHSELVGRRAEKVMQQNGMTKFMYGKVLANTLVAVLVLPWPGGFTWRTFLSLGASNTLVYFNNAWRVLRGSTATMHTTWHVEYVCQQLLAPIVGLILVIAVFKTNCYAPGFCVRGVPFWSMGFSIWLGHTLLHISLLSRLPAVYKFVELHGPEDTANEATFADIATKGPATWFSASLARSRGQIWAFPMGCDSALRGAVAARGEECPRRAVGPAGGPACASFCRSEKGRFRPTP